MMMKRKVVISTPLRSLLLAAYCLLCAASFHSREVQAAEHEPLREPLTALNLAGALNLAQQSYTLKSQRLQVDIQAAQVLQAKQWNNPSLQLAAENVPNLTGTGAELHLMWQQPLNPAQQEYIEVAQQQQNVSQWSLQQQSLALKRDVTQAFYEVLMWQAYLEQTQQLLDNALRMQKVIEAQYAQGKLLLAERNRSQIAQEQLQIQQQNTQIQHQEAQTILAEHINRTPPFVLQGNLIVNLESTTADFPLGTPSFEQKIALHPELQERQAYVTQAQKKVLLQQALIWQQSTWSVGARIVPDENNLGALTQLNIPVPVLHQNQGEIQGSERELAQAQVQHQNAAFLLRTRWQQTLNSYRLTLQNLQTYQKHLLPLAQKNRELTQHTYQQGKQSYLEVLDAQRSEISLQQAYLLQWGQYHRLRAELVYLLPVPAPSVETAILK